MTIRLNGSTSGYTELDAPAVAGSNTLRLPTSNGSAHQLLKNGATAGQLEYGFAMPSSNGSAGQSLITDGSGNTSFGSSIVSGTAKASTSGTAIDFSPADGTGIPSWAKRITVIFSGVSTSGTSSLLLQLGTSSGVESTGYTSTSYAQTNVVLTSTFGFILNSTAVAATDARHGLLTVANITGNSWVAMGATTVASGQLSSCTGTKQLSAALDRIRITTVSGTDAFDAGLINILYE